MKQAELLQLLMSKADPKLADFQTKLTPGANKMLGLRLGDMREIAKQISKEPETYLNEEVGEYFEEMMVRGLVIAYGKFETEQRINLINKFVPTINNWAVCDSLVSTMKFINKEKVRYWELIDRYFHSNNEFEIRFTVVTSFSYFLTDDYIDQVLELYKAIHHDGYYVKMAIAWGISVAFVKQREKALQLIESKEIEKWTHNKSIQKCCESFRVSDSDKELLRSLKIK